MNSFIKGNVREIFYKTEKGYMVGIFKIRETNDTIVIMFFMEI